MTDNYKFIKPEKTDPANITSTNENWDKLDEALDNRTRDLSMGGHQIKNVGEPLLRSDVATRGFVEDFSIEGNTYVAVDENNDGNVVLRPYIPLVDDAADYIIERGTDGIWEYEKWHSGKAVCWCSYPLKLTLDNAWGTGNAHFYDIIPSQNFPTDLFIERPKIEVHSEEDSGNTFVTKQVTTKDITGEMYCVSPNTLTGVTVYIDIEAKGKWKSGDN